MTQNEKAAAAKKRSHVIMIIILVLLFILFIIPFVLVIINVFKVKTDIVADPLALVGEHGFTLQNFPQAMEKMNFFVVFKNSLIITVCSTILTILVSAMASFVQCIFLSITRCFVVYDVNLSLTNGEPFGTSAFMFHGAIHTNIPLELEEAALIDGCSRWQTFWKIVFPLLKPTVATVAIIDAMAFWNDYLLPSLVLTGKELYTIPIATQAFYGTYSSDIGLIMAALLLAMLPILILYLFLQKYIVAGVTAGAVKG